MRYSKEGICEAAQGLITKDCVVGNPTYDWIDIVAIPGRPQKLGESLFFASHSNGEGGWDNGFDRRPYACERAKKEGCHLAVDKSLDASGISYLETHSLNELANSLYLNARAESKPYVIGITGSVGKTTTVAFLEHLLRTSGVKVERFYSKRLSPLSVSCHYINKVNPDTECVVMEYSAYLSDHVSQLSQVLPPNIAFLLNVYDTHINPGMFKDRQDIVNSKVRIRPETSVGFINNAVVDELHMVVPKGWGGFSVIVPPFRDNSLLPPTLRTAEMFTVGKLLADEIGISDEILRRAFSTYVPQENRILQCNYRGKDIFFHGETSGGGRLWSWFETLDKSVPWFLVEEVNFADEDPQGFKGLLERVFNSDKTYVLDTPTNREKLPVSAHFVNPGEFQSVLERANGYIVYHKALATRQSDFNQAEYLNGRW